MDQYEPKKRLDNSRIFNHETLNIVQRSRSTTADTASNDPVLVVLWRLNARPRSGALSSVGVCRNTGVLWGFEVIVGCAEINNIIPWARKVKEVLDIEVC